MAIRWISRFFSGRFRGGRKFGGLGHLFSLCDSLGGYVLHKLGSDRLAASQCYQLGEGCTVAHRQVGKHFAIETYTRLCET